MPSVAAVGLPAQRQATFNQLELKSPWPGNTQPQPHWVRLYRKLTYQMVKGSVTIKMLTV
ncbi:hypothetical protein [Phormidium tenue]|uniref:Uncharacterized protein n=1 Tax=Phormidium tenue NIES-30 TaxID=549789 RepID=A0A1U7J3B0_9CYAN|nr:hypothetical protein [Phormidium tenue]MBD2233358.1 hypothetical protein [Phormidium tenue FACHB-1052]OKH46822.1 hypothetical protein NIES30_15040 [Phormidium tenue NIES-30]